MKTIIIFALCVAAAAADPINHFAMERMFQDFHGIKIKSNAISVGSAIVDSDLDDTKMARNSPIQIYINVNSGSQTWTRVNVGRSSAVDAEYKPISDGPTFMDSVPIDNKMARYSPRIFVNVNSGSQVWDSVAVGTAASATEHEPISVGPAIIDTEYEPISVGPAIVNTENEPISDGTGINDTPPLFTEVINTSQMQIYTNFNADSQVWESALQSLLSLAPNTSPFDPLSLLLKMNQSPSSSIVSEAKITEPINIIPVVIPGPVVPFWKFLTK